MCCNKRFVDGVTYVYDGVEVPGLQSSLKWIDQWLEGEEKSTHAGSGGGFKGAVELSALSPASMPS